MADKLTVGENLSNVKYHPGGYSTSSSLFGPVGQNSKGPGTVPPGGNKNDYDADDRSGRGKNKPKPFYRTSDQIIDIKNQLTSQYAVRDMMYRFLQRIYDGDFWRQISEDIRVGGFKYRRYRTDDKYRLVVNYVFSVTNDYVDLMSKIPSIHVPALHASDSLSQDHASFVEKVLYGIWEASRMEKQMYDLAWYLALLGSAVVESTLDPSDDIPKLIVQHPGTHYVREKFGRPNEVLYGFQRAFLEPAQVKDAWGDEWKDNGMYSNLDTRTGQWATSDDWTPNMSRIEVIIFYTPWERTLMIQNKVINGYSVQYEEAVEVPFRTIHFLKRPGKGYGIGAAEQTWALNQYLNQLFSMEANILSFAANPILIVKEPTQVPSDIPNDPGSVVSVGPQGDVHWLQWHGAVPEVTQQMERTKKYLQDVAGMPETRYGAAKQSFLTGRAVDQLNAPTQDRIASRLRLVGDELQHINRIALWQFEHGSYNREVELYGASADGDSFALKAKGKDIHGYYRNLVTWDNHDHGDAVETLQLYGAGLMDRRSAIVSLGMREPDQIIKRIRQDKEEDIEITRLYEEAKLVTLAPQEVEGLIPGEEAILGPAGMEQMNAGLQGGGQIAGAQGAQQMGGPPGAGAGPAPAPQQGPVPGGPGAPQGTPPPAASLHPQTAARHQSDLETLSKGEVPPPPGPLDGGGLNGPPNGMPPQGPVGTGQSPVRRGFGPSANLHLNGMGGSFNLETVVNDFRALPPDKIRGRVWLTGPIVGGAADKINVFVSAGVDKKTILDLLPDYQGKLEFEKGKTPPAHAVEVTPVPFGGGPKMQNAGVTGGLPVEPDAGNEGVQSKQTNAPGLRKNPPGLMGPQVIHGIATPVYQPLPTPTPGEGPLPNAPTLPIGPH